MDNDSKIKLVAEIAANILQDINRERIMNNLKTVQDNEKFHLKMNEAISIASCIVDSTTIFVEDIITDEGEKNHAEVS